MTSLFRRISFVSALMLAMSLPASSGAEKIAHMLKCARYSSLVIPPLPTSSMSGSFQCPGPAYDSRPFMRSRICVTPPPPQAFLQSQQSLISGGARHRFPIGPAHSQGFVDPHSQMLKTMGRPESARALRIKVYEDSLFCPGSVLHQSSFR